MRRSDRLKKMMLDCQSLIEAQDSAYVKDLLQQAYNRLREAFMLVKAKEDEGKPWTKLGEASTVILPQSNPTKKPDKPHG